MKTQSPCPRSKAKKRRYLMMAAVLCVVVSLFIFQPFQQSINLRQVVKTAPEQASEVLAIDRHISLTERPAETFDFPIALGQTGPIQSLYAGAPQYPFYCMTVDSGLEQPLIDNQSGLGVPVYLSLDNPTTIIGYSKDCTLPSQLSYYLLPGQGKTRRVDPDKPLKLRQGDQLVRVEQGTINRFIYTIAMPIKAEEIGQRQASSLWNKRLIYQLFGGVGIGYRQGKQRASSVIHRQLERLRQGYAVISSSGNKTSYTYNMLLAEDTARRVKRQFTSLYGEPLYTVGVGGSGGGLAQYLIGQNSRGILDGLIPLYSYPDMITQTTYALDCDLFNNYFTFRNHSSNWNDWKRRQLIEGMNTLNNFPQQMAYLQPINQLIAGFAPSLPEGNSECINGYFGLASLINNPKQGFLKSYFHPSVNRQTKWSYWQDLSAILGQDANGYGLSTWDNVGVQYGLTALQKEQLSFAEFIDINQKIGGWKSQHQMQEERIKKPFGKYLPLWLSLWSNHNITAIENGIAARHQGSIEAMQAAYRSGQVFIGRADLPIIDIRHYLEDELDMHHVSASFYSRSRIEQANGDSDNHIIWIADKDYTPLDKAFAMMDQWLLRKSADNRQALIAAKPKQLQDSCFDADGRIIAQGKTVWDGDWNQRPRGACQQFFPVYSTSRIQAGGPWSGQLFKCQLMPVEQALKHGLYGDIDAQQALPLLRKTFPEGVCDYSQPDLGLPGDLLMLAGQSTAASH